MFTYVRFNYTTVNITYKTSVYPFWIYIREYTYVKYLLIFYVESYRAIVDISIVNIITENILIFSHIILLYELF